MRKKTAFLGGIALLLVAACPAVASDASRRLVGEGAALLAQRHYEKALASFEAAQKADPGDAEPLFFEGVALNRLRRPAEALARIQESFRRGYRHADTDFELGWSLLKLKRWEEAARSLEQFEREHPGRGQTSEFLGRAYFGRGLLDLAKAKFEEAMRRDKESKQTSLVYLASIAQAQHQPAVASKNTLEIVTEWPRSPMADLFRRRIEEAGYSIPGPLPQKPWWLSASAAGGYNSNVISLGSNIPLPVDITHQFATFGHFTLDGGYRWSLAHRNSLAVAYDFQSDIYHEVATSNLFDHYWSLNFTHSLTPKVSVSLVGGDELTEIGGNKFRTEVGLRPVIDWRWTPRMVTEASMNFLSSDFFFPVATPAQNRDSNTSVFNLAQFYTPRRHSQLHWRAGFTHTKNRATGTDFDFETNAYELGVGFPLFFKINGNVTYARQTANYQNPNSLAGAGFAFARGDDINQVTASLSRPIRRRLSAIASFSHTRDDSNINFYRYTQDAISAGLTATF